MITWNKIKPILKNLQRRWFGKPILSKIIIASWRYILQILGLVKIRRMIDNLNEKKCVLTRPKLIYVNDRLNMIYVNNMRLMIYFNHNHAVVVEWHTYRHPSVDYPGGTQIRKDRKFCSKTKEINVSWENGAAYARLAWTLSYNVKLIASTIVLIHTSLSNVLCSCLSIVHVYCLVKIQWNSNYLEKLS